MKPPQHGAPLNFLIYPYVEVDGKPLPKDQIKNQFEYADIGRRTETSRSSTPLPFFDGRWLGRACV